MEAFKNNHPIIPITIDKTKYNISIYFSTKDALFISSACKEKAPSYIEAVATLLHNHIIDTDILPAIADIAIDTVAIDCFIDAILNNDERIKDAYDISPIEDNKQKRFVLAAKEAFNQLMQSTLQQASQAISPYLQNIGQATSILSSYIDSAMQTWHKSVIPSISVTLSTLQKALAPVNKISAIVTSLTNSISNYLTPLFQNIHIPSISEAEKEALNASFKQWGEYGWTLMPHADLYIFKEAPDNFNNANKSMQVWCKKEAVEDLFILLRNSENAKKADLEESIACYQSKKYKACAMLLFSLLDAEFIRMQREEDRNPKTKRRPTGSTAAKNISKHIAKEHNIEKRFLLLLTYTNLFACIDTLFKDAQDFKKQPLLINRNFLQHGMLTKPVRKRDCIQLFLLYYNFLEFLEIINSK